MGDGDGNLRVGNSEREEAVRALGEHLAQGRLEISEYDQRCGQAAAARTRAELAQVFDDLPEPNPMRQIPAQARSQPPAAVPPDAPLVEKSRNNTKVIVIGFVVFSVTAIITVTAILGEWWALIPALLIVAVLAMVS
ncbi:MAG: DUF1707 domain-containing protein [Kibdelosporangium sp.]